MKSRDIVPERGVRGLLPELEFLRTEGAGGGRRHEGLGALLSVSPYAGVRPRGETL